MTMLGLFGVAVVLGVIVAEAYEVSWEATAGLVGKLGLVDRVAVAQLEVMAGGIVAIVGMLFVIWLKIKR